MKPLEILSAIPKWASATPDQIVDSPAFALACRLGDESATIRLDAIQGDDTLDLEVLFDGESHVLGLSRSPRFAELDKVWDCRADVPEPVLLALAEKECGVLFQMLENIVRKQLRLVGLSSSHAGSEGRRTLFAQVADVTFALTRSDAVVAACGTLRNLDLSHSALRDETLPAEVEYAAFVVSAADLAALAVGDVLLLPEVGTVLPRIVVDGRFVVDETGVSPFSDDGRCRVVAAEARSLSLGEVFDAAEDPESRKTMAEGLVPGLGTPLQLRLVQNNKVVASGRLDRLGDQAAFVVEAKSV